MLAENSFRREPIPFHGVLLITAAILFWVPPATARADDVVIAADEWCPYNCVADSDRPGFMVEIARAAFEPTGRRVEYRVLNWARAIQLGRQGDIHGIIGAFRGDAPDFVFPDEPLGLSGNGLFVKADDPWRYTGPNSLSGRRVGVIRGYDYGNYNLPLRDYADVDVVSGNDALTVNIRKLLLGRIDSFIEDIYVARYRLEQMEVADKVVMAVDRPDHVEAFIAFSPALPDSALYAEILTTAVRRLRHTGELDRILARYGVSDWKQLNYLDCPAIAATPDRWRL